MTALNESLAPATRTRRDAKPLDSALPPGTGAAFVPPLAPVVDPVAESLKIAAPTWPLQSSVAVNPFWNLRDRAFEDAFAELSPVLHASLYMPTAYYLGRVDSGAISRAALAEALGEVRRRRDGFHASPEALLEACVGVGPAEDRWRTFAEVPGVDRAAMVVNEVGKYAAAFLDDRQALATFPWKDRGFWKGWAEAQRWDRTLRAYGLSAEAVSLSGSVDLDAREAIAVALKEMGLAEADLQTGYLRRAFATVLGWATQFKHAEWQRGLGYAVETTAAAIDLLAVRVAYDLFVFRAETSRRPERAGAWRKSLRAAADAARTPGADPRIVLQLADEYSYQAGIASELARPRANPEGAGDAKLVFCIDVRSEMVRRHIEAASPTIRTGGFAGFFGLPFDYHRGDEAEAGHRLPVLLTPAYSVKDARKGPGSASLVASYFRSLRKRPLSSFLYVELFGAFHAVEILRRTGAILARSAFGKRIPERFDPKGTGPTREGLTTGSGEPVGPDALADRVSGVLAHMGLHAPFPRIVGLVGHGSHTTNNAFGASLDCGACGGHAGDVNARFLADLLNDGALRERLGRRGIAIPTDTWFVAAVHETVTDEIHFLDVEKIPASHRRAVESLRTSLRRASESTRAERNVARSTRLDPDAGRRSRNWADIRPEWGLAGNACFVVAPRVRTLGANLSSRSFLHDYDWKRDEATGYATLELIMTAPMVVTNWINLQYYASTTAPAVYGAGTKVLHNLVNEAGVVEGNGGDLRTGLPIESVHDGERFTHEPLRLSVFIEAPGPAIEAIIAKHAVVRDLVENGWLHLLRIEPGTGQILRRRGGGLYAAV